MRLRTVPYLLVEFTNQHWAAVVYVLGDDSASADAAAPVQCFSCIDEG